MRAIVRKNGRSAHSEVYATALTTQGRLGPTQDLIKILLMCLRIMV